MRALVVCDSFKGSLTSREVGACVQTTLRQMGISADYLIVSDGGEGYLDALQFGCGSFVRHWAWTCDSLFRRRRGAYLQDGDTLYFDLADVVGICLLRDDEKDAYVNSTYGLGLLMQKAIRKHRPRSVVLAIGGSSTNDLGLGILEGLGAKFYSDGEELRRLTLKDFDKITSMDLSAVYALTAGIRFTTLTDVTNPLLGENGATYIYGEQKGIKKADMPTVDRLLAAVKEKVAAVTGRDPADRPGSGAAGGVGFIMQSVFGSDVKSGIDELLTAIRFADKVRGYDVVITGEGCFDSQSLNGKVISGIRKYDVKKLIIISAVKKIEYENAYSIVPEITTKENSLQEPKKYLKALIEKIFEDVRRPGKG